MVQWVKSVEDQAATSVSFHRELLWFTCASRLNLYRLRVWPEVETSRQSVIITKTNVVLDLKLDSFKGDVLQLSCYCNSHFRSSAGDIEIWCVTVIEVCTQISLTFATTISEPAHPEQDKLWLHPKINHLVQQIVGSANDGNILRTHVLTEAEFSWRGITIDVCFFKISDGFMLNSW